MMSVGSGCTTDDTPTSPGAGANPIDPSFSQTIQPIFENEGCTASQCHGQTQSAGLGLRAGTSYGQLVNIAATQETGIRVIPGSADSSYLIIKLEGNQTIGSQMPNGGNPLDPADIQLIKNWINQGAKDN